MNYNQKLKKKGRSWYLTLEPLALEILNINPENDLVEYHMDKKVLIITRKTTESEDPVV